MCVLLCKRHSATETNRTRETVRKIVLLIAETNLTSTIVALSTLVLFLVLKGVYFTFPSIILGKVYSNSLFLILNNRIYLTDDVPGGIKIKNGPEKLQKDPYVNGNFGMTILRTKESSGEGANVEWMAGVRVDVHTARHLDEP
ncbi:hypothetical protein CPB83DRAFT_258564 [Crepidotus variabilis]|uniref:DUF6534 domain-containing protein n=1 Tax=Crepidotus variabilis TaxID=179855 RepID=A0A9P6EIM3_9AGAR|nr:hypothetical protein CPB83DRAFT_258564 [Crepidotus variabilis]